MVQVVRTGEGDAAVWHVVGELDLGSAEVLETAIVPNGQVRLTLDLSEMTFIDSTGLHTLEKLANGADRVLVLRAPTELVLKVLRMVGLDAHPCIEIEE